MKYIFLFFLVTTAMSINIKKCINCKYFIQNKHVNDIIFGKCFYYPLKLDKVFNLISGELIEDNSDYEYCITARNYNNLCGPNGKNYLEKNISIKNNYNKITETIK
jgi:hypothetical protein